VRFASPTFRDETRVRYRYRLLGARDEWSEPTPERSIAYAGLAPGHYEFQVHAIDTDGQTSERPATIAFIIVPRPWQTWWFRLAALALVIAAVGAVILGRIRAADAERVRLEAIVEQRTRELSDKNGALEREIGDRQAAEDALRLSQERLLEVVEHSTNLFYSHGADGVLTYISPQSRRILGCEPEQALGNFHSFLTDHPANAAGLEATRRALATGERQPAYELELRGSDGILRWVEVNEAPVTGDGRAIRMVGSLTDITDAKRAAAEQDRLQLQLRQAQKMEAVGRLAGGIAHDFNNLLTAVVGNTEIVAGGLEPDDPLQEDLAQVRQAADRAASLVTQLLAFSRQQLIRRSTLDLNGIVADSARMLGRTLGTDVELHLELAADPLWIEGDQAQLEQVVINLALNARDAMPGGGRLVISTHPVVLDGQLAQNGMENCVPDGCYAALRVIDTGHGMDPETVRHAFEPFFTTKPLAKGTGLGLATVYGIVTQNGGSVRIESEPGRGTTFHVFLPRVTPPPAPDDGAAAPGADSDGGARGPAEAERRARVLVVEDEPAVRRLVCRTLSAAGFEVLEAEDGAVALSVSTGYAGAIDLLLTDMIMPGLNGREVAECITASRSTTRVLYMSGHTNEMLGSRFMLDETTQVLEKPFAPDDLIRRVRATLA
jgi:PAS domain S-box-containing protein